MLTCSEEKKQNDVIGTELKEELMIVREGLSEEVTLKNVRWGQPCRVTG